MLPETFSTLRLRLRPLVADDAIAIFESYGSDPEVTRYLTWRAHASIADTEKFVGIHVNAQEGRTYMMELAGSVAGVFEVRSAGRGRLEVGYALARPHWGRGLMTEALVEVKAWALRQTAIWRVGAFADVENFGSIRVMEKAGLLREGVVRRWVVHPNLSDEPRDCVIYAATR